MSSQDDQLRLSAQLVDQFSGPLREMTKSVHSFQDMLRGGTKQTIKDNKEHAKLQKDLNEQFVNTGRTISGIVTPAMGALGLSVGGAGASIAELISKLKNAGGEFYKIQGAMKRTGLSSSELDAQSRMLTKITGQSIEASRAQLAGLGDVAAQLSRNYSPTLQALESTFNNLHGLITKMSGDTAAQAIDDFMEYYESHPASPDQQRKLLAAVGLNPDLADASGDQIRKTLQETRAFVAANPDLTSEARQKLLKGFSELDDAADGFGRAMERNFGGPVIAFVDGLTVTLHGLTKDLKDFDDWWNNKAKAGNNWTTGKDHSGNDVPAGLDPKIKEFFRPSIPNASPNKGEFKDRWEGLYHPSAFKSGGGYALLQGGDAGSETIWGELGRKVGPAFANGIYGVIIGGANSLYHDPKQLFRGPLLPNGKNAFQDLFQPAGFGGGGSSEDLLSRGVKRGTLEALREYSASLDGIQNAAYTTGGGDSSNPMLRGNTPKFGNKDFPDLGDGVGGLKGGGHRKLAKMLGMDQHVDSTGPVDRSSFAGMLDDPAFVRKMASMGKGEVGLNSNLKTQRAIAEQAFNRWYVRNQKAGHDLYHGRGGYYAAGSFPNVSPAEVAKYKRDVLGPVLNGGTNDAMGTTGNASNEPGNMVAAHQFARGTKGYWMNLKSGEKTDVPSTYMGGKNEAMFNEGPYKRQLAMREPRNLLANANAAGVNGGGQQKIEGGADLRVAFENAPSGMKAHLKNWGVFGDPAKVDWGHAMSPSDPGGR